MVLTDLLYVRRRQTHWLRCGIGGGDEVVVSLRNGAWSRDGAKLALRRHLWVVKARLGFVDPLRILFLEGEPVAGLVKNIVCLSCAYRNASPGQEVDLEGLYGLRLRLAVPLQREVRHFILLKSLLGRLDSEPVGLRGVGLRLWALLLAASLLHDLLLELLEVGEDGQPGGTGVPDLEERRVEVGLLVLGLDVGDCEVGGGLGLVLLGEHARRGLVVGVGQRTGPVFKPGSAELRDGVLGDDAVLVRGQVAVLGPDSGLFEAVVEILLVPAVL